MAGPVPAILIRGRAALSAWSLPGLTRQSMRRIPNLNRKNFDGGDSPGVRGSRPAPDGESLRHGTCQKRTADRSGGVAKAFAVLEEVLLARRAARSATPSAARSQSPAPAPGFRFSGNVHTGASMAVRLPPYTLALQRAADLVQNRRVVDGGRHGPGLAVGDLLDGAAQDLARARLRQPLNRDGEAERGDRADLVAHQLNDLPLDLLRRAVDAGLEHDEAARHLALELVLDAEHGALGDVGVGGQHLLHAAGREPVAGDVDDVVGAAHDEDVAVLVLVAGIRRLVVAGELGEVALLEALVVPPQRRERARRHRQLDHDRADRAGRLHLVGVVDDVD